MRNLIAKWITKWITKLVIYMNNMHIPDETRYTHEPNEVQEIINKHWKDAIFIPYAGKRERSAAECDRGGSYVR